MGKLQTVKRRELLLFLAATGGYTAKGKIKPPTTTRTPSGTVDTAA